MDSEYISGTEAATYLGVTRRHIYGLAKEGRIGTEIAGRYVYTYAQLDAYNAHKKIAGRPRKHLHKGTKVL